jgi:uncharacterized protein YkwD
MAASRSIEGGLSMHSFLIHARRTLLVLAGLMVAIGSARGQDAKPKDSGRPAARIEPVDPALADLLAAHNKVRAEEKRPPLKLNSRLTDAARSHARDMAEHEHLTHDGSDGSDPAKRVKRAGYVYRAIGENVAAGEDTVAEAMRSWIESPPHRENILGDFTEMGGAVAKGQDGRSYWCVDFGRPIPPVDPEKSPRELIAALNRARSDAKKRPLKPDAHLVRVAAGFAREAAARKSLDIEGREGQSPFDVLKREGYRSRRLGATAAFGEGDPGKVVAAWLQEPRDRDSLLSGFDRVGVGVATDSEGVPYWVVLLAQGATR